MEIQFKVVLCCKFWIYWVGVNNKIYNMTMQLKNPMKYYIYSN